MRNPPKTSSRMLKMEEELDGTLDIDCRAVAESRTPSAESNRVPLPDSVINTAAARKPARDLHANQMSVQIMNVV